MSPIGRPCPVCGDAVAEGPARRCPSCETPHHPECWEWVEGCARYACVAGPASSRAVLVAPPGSRELWIDDLPPLQARLLRLGQLSPLVWFGAGAGCLAGAVLLNGLSMGQLDDLSGLLALAASASLALVGICLLLGCARLPEVVAELAARPGRLVPETKPKLLEARLADSPRSVHLLEALAHSRMVAGDLEAAQELYGQCLMQLPANPRYLNLRARALAGLGRYREARALLELAGRTDPTGLEGGRARRWLPLVRRLGRGEPTRRDPGAPPSVPPEAPPPSP